jgi:serine/threonine protein phosphatase PrpC
MANNFFGITDIGKQRDNNEDTFIAQKADDGNYIIACVIDGVGGYSGGEVAADIARECILEQLSYIAGDIVPLMVNTITTANQRIYEQKLQNKQLENMACVLTLAVIDIQNNQFHYAHVGDTRLYLLRDNSLIKISKDHSFVGFLEDSGRLSEEAAMDHPKRNEINKALGFNPQIAKDPDFVETGHSPFLPGDLLLICSDGLTDMVDKSLITKILTGSGSIQNKGEKLIDAANSRGGKDNVTVVLVQNDKAPRQHNATRPTANTKVTEEIIDPLAQPKLPEGPAIIPGKSKSNRGTMVVLFIMLALAIAGFLWQFWLNYQLKQPTVKVLAAAPVKVKNAEELKLQDTINKLKGNTLIISEADFKQPIVLSDTLHIQKDSLYIKAKGSVIFKRDSAYTGPGISLAANSKYIVLDSVAFDGFNVAVATRNDALVLKHVVFNNCAVPVQTSYIFPQNKFVSGRLFGGMFKIDTLSKTTK